MEQMPLQDMLDHQRWLIGNGLFTDLAKDNLYLYGSLLHTEIEALHVVIDAEQKVITYNLFVRPSLLKTLERFNTLSKSTGLIDMWRFKRLLKKEGNLNFLPLLTRFVRDYCGPKWTAALNVDDVANYVDGPDEQRVGESTEPDKQPNG